MAKIVRVTIRTAPSFGCINYLEEERLSVTRDSVEYEYRMPQKASGLEAKEHRKWKYRSASPKFARLFDEASFSICELIHTMDWFAYDGAEMRFTLTYDDGKRETRTFFGPPPGEPFAALREMVGQCCELPGFLMKE